MSAREVTLSALQIALLLCLRALWPVAGGGTKISEKYIYDRYIAPVIVSDSDDMVAIGGGTLAGSAEAADPGVAVPGAAAPEAVVTGATVAGGAGVSGAGARLLTGRVDVNRASAAELEALPGVGPTLAARIVEGRPYRRLSDLDRVKGVGPKLLERLGPYVTF